MFTVTGDKHSRVMVFSAELSNIDLADTETRSFLDAHDLNALSFNILLCMREALSNAVIHGCCRDSERSIRYEIRLTDDVLTLDIEDQGDGFDWRNHPHDMPEPESTRGRGLAIMEQFFSSVQFNEHGNHLTLTMVIPRGMNMSDLRRDGAMAVITPGKDIVASMADEFREELKDLIQDGVTQLTIDLSNVTMMDSIGMGLLIAAHNSLRNGGGKLLIVKASDDILGLFKTMRLDKHFDIIES